MQIIVNGSRFAGRRNMIVWVCRRRKKGGIHSTLSGKMGKNWEPCYPARVACGVALYKQEARRFEPDSKLICWEKALEVPWSIGSMAPKRSRKPCKVFRLLGSQSGHRQSRDCRLPNCMFCQGRFPREDIVVLGRMFYNALVDANNDLNIDEVTAIVERHFNAMLRKWCGD